jgi:O-antigen/teichoic acid export membrane protein
MVLLRLRSERELVAFPVTFLLQRLVSIALGALAARQFDFEVMLIVFIGVDIVTYVALSFFRLRRPDYSWPLISELRYLVSIGFPMMVTGILRVGQISGEKLLIVVAMDASDLGIYQVAWVPVGAAIAINGVIAQFLGPKMLQEYGGHRSVQRVFRESVRISFGLLALGLAASPLALLLAQPFVDRFVAPEYSDSADAMRILYFSGVIMVANMFHMTMIASNRPRTVLYVQVFTSVLTLAAYAIVINVTADIVWVAIVSVGGMACDFTARFIVAWLIARSDEVGSQPEADALAAAQLPDVPVG